MRFFCCSGGSVAPAECVNCTRLYGIIKEARRENTNLKTEKAILEMKLKLQEGERMLRNTRHEMGMLEAEMQAGRLTQEIVSTESLNVEFLGDDLKVLYNSWLNEQHTAFETKVDEIVADSNKVIDTLVETIKAAITVEREFPRKHTCVFCLDSKHANEFSAKRCGHAVCTKCVISNPINVNSQPCFQCSDTNFQCGPYFRLFL
jgi:hypothetical protein